MLHYNDDIQLDSPAVNFFSESCIKQIRFNGSDHSVIISLIISLDLATFNGSDHSAIISLDLAAEPHDHSGPKYFRFCSN